MIKKIILKLVCVGGWATLSDLHDLWFFFNPWLDVARWPAMFHDCYLSAEYD